MIWATVSSWSCFCWQYRASPPLAAKNIISLILVLAIRWCPCVDSSLLLLEEGALTSAMTSAFSWQNSVSLYPASFRIPRPNMTITSGVSWLPPFVFQYPKRKGHLLGVLVLKGLVGLHKTVQLQLLQHYWLGHRLGLPWYWIVCFGNEQRSSCHFWDCIQVLHTKLTSL